MRKLVAAPILLAFLVVLFGAGAAQAAPDALKCPEKFDPTKPTSMNCLSDEIFILNGAELVSLTPGAPAAPLVNCANKPTMTVADSKNCFYGDVSRSLSIEGLELAAAKAVELMRAKVPQLPEWDEIVVFASDFGPTTQPGPLFYRAPNAALQLINPVSGIGLGAPVPRDPAKPYIGIINAGNTKTLPANPATGQYGPCGTAPRRAADDPVPTNQSAPALCAPPFYNYFDSLAQATANLYGPYLTVDVMAHGGSLWSMPAIKTTLVDFMNGTVGSKVMGGPATNVWNALLNTRGSLLGGNTFADNGNGTWSVTRPPAYQGVSLPFEGTQALRFQPLDLYAMGLLPSSSVAPIQSFMHAGPGNVYQPAGLNGFSPAVGPAMGTRLSGVSLRGSGIGTTKAVPEMINFGDVIAASGGERNPPHATAPQAIRQLWVMVTKPEAVMDIVAGDGGAKKEDQQKDQPVQLANLQKYRRAYSSYFYALTGYRGRVFSTFEGNVDDVAVFEFGGARDDLASFQTQGSLKLAIPGPEEIPNSGGKQLTVLRVTETNGADGRIRFNPAVHNIRIEGKQEIGSAPNNILTVRMRVPSNPQLLADLKANSGERLRASFIFEAPGKTFSVDLPKSPDAFLVPDGKFRNYSVNLSAENDFKAGTWTGFTLIPSNQMMRDIEIEFIKIGWSDNVKDTDKSCLDADQADGWLDVEDNCPKLFNPAQEDGNNDGIGDACEDYDGDNKLNSCDNCPTTTNTSQRDANNNKIGDACDGSKGDTCFFQEATIAGAGAPSSALLWVGAAAFGVMVGGALRRRRRRP